MTMNDGNDFRLARLGALATTSRLLLLLLFGTVTRASAVDCAAATTDFCVCCPPSDCRAERGICPGDVGGLLILKAENPGCSVQVYQEARCRSGGMIASERRSDLSVYRTGSNVRIDLTAQQLDTLVEELRELAR